MRQIIEKQIGITFDNIHGTYEGREVLWNSLFHLQCLKKYSLIIEGDLNFSLNRREIWGHHVKPNMLAWFFHNHLVQSGLVDVEAFKIRPSYVNNKHGVEEVSKQLGMFLVHFSLLQGFARYKSWIGSSRCLDHYHIWFELGHK